MPERPLGPLDELERQVGLGDDTWRRLAATPDDHVVFPRLIALMKLLAQVDRPPSTGRAAVRAGLAVRDERGVLHVGFPEFVDSWRHLLIEGYERGRILSGGIVLGVLKNQHRRQIRRELKVIAVELMGGGADVRGLTADAVPVVAYALLVNALPTSVEPGSPEAIERVNDLLLSAADDIPDLPASELSPVFMDLFRLAVVLGEAQRYASQLSIVGLSLQEAPVRTRTSRRRIATALAAAGGAAAALLAGFVIGSAGSGGKPAAASKVTVTNTHVVTHRVVVPRTTTVVQVKHVPRTTTVEQTTTVPGAAVPGASATTTVTVATTVRSAPADPRPRREEGRARSVCRRDQRRSSDGSARRRGLQPVLRVREARQSGDPGGRARRCGEDDVDHEADRFDR